MGGLAWIRSMHALYKWSYIYIPVSPFQHSRPGDHGSVTGLDTFFKTYFFGEDKIYDGIRDIHEETLRDRGGRGRKWGTRRLAACRRARSFGETLILGWIPTSPSRTSAEKIRAATSSTSATGRISMVRRQDHPPPEPPLIKNFSLSLMSSYAQTSCQLFFSQYFLNN